MAPAAAGACALASGGGSYHLAFMATGVTIVALLLLHPLENVIAARFNRPDNDETGKNKP